MTQGTEDERQGTGDVGWETKYKDVRVGTKDIRQGQEKGKEECVTGGKRGKTLKNARGAPKWLSRMLIQRVSIVALHMLSQRVTNFRAGSANE